MNNHVIFISANRTNGRIVPNLPIQDIKDLVSSSKIVIIKGLFPEEEMNQLRNSVYNWGLNNPTTETDDFKGNYHAKKAKVSNIQQVPHVFHDYNFNNVNTLENPIKNNLESVFNSLRILYNELTNQSIELGFIEGAPYFHPQLIQYPNGGGFFGRHNHNLLPQQIGFILSVSKINRDFKGGSTCFVVDNEVVDLEEFQEIGDLCLWKNDLDHWVKQTPLEDQFKWDTDDGRWVATLAYFNPF